MTTASMLLAGTGKGSQLRRRIARGPWNIPQSMRMRPVGAESRKREPVTVPAAPRKVSSIGDGSDQPVLIGLPSGPRLIGCPPRVTMGGGSRSLRNCRARMMA